MKGTVSHTSCTSACDDPLSIAHVLLRTQVMRVYLNARFQEVSRHPVVLSKGVKIFIDQGQGTSCFLRRQNPVLIQKWRSSKLTLLQAPLLTKRQHLWHRNPHPMHYQCQRNLSRHRLAFKNVAVHCARAKEQRIVVLSHAAFD